MDSQDSKPERYDIVDRIAVGGMAEVFEAKVYGDHGFEKTVAVKRILPELASDREFAQRFIAEAKVAVRLSHANIVQVFDFGRIGESMFIAMEYVDGLDLAALLRQLREQKRQIPLPAAFHIAIEILRGLDYAHQHGVVHRDVSPSNILLSRAGEVKIADFGIAVAARPHRSGEPGPRKVMGKWRYMSPEQTRGDTLDTRSDLFSAASVIYEIFTGEKLFPGEDAETISRHIAEMAIPRVSAMRPGLPVRLDAILAGPLARQPQERPARASVVLRALIELSYETNIVATSLDLAEMVNAMLPPSVGVPRAAIDEVIRRQLSAAHEPSARQTAITAPPAAEQVSQSTGVWVATLGLDGLSQLEQQEPTIVAQPRARRASVPPQDAVSDPFAAAAARAATGTGAGRRSLSVIAPMFGSGADASEEPDRRTEVGNTAALAADEPSVVTSARRTPDRVTAAGGHPDGGPGGGPDGASGFGAIAARLPYEETPPAGVEGGSAIPPVRPSGKLLVGVVSGERQASEPSADVAPIADTIEISAQFAAAAVAGNAHKAAPRDGGASPRSEGAAAVTRAVDDDGAKAAPAQTAAPTQARDSVPDAAQTATAIPPPPAPSSSFERNSESAPPLHMADPEVPAVAAVAVTASRLREARVSAQHNAVAPLALRGWRAPWRWLALGFAVLLVAAFAVARLRRAAPAAVRARADAVLAADLATLELDSRPQGARVIAAGQLVGTTPTRLNVPPGTVVDLRFEKPGYEPYTDKAAAPLAGALRVAPMLTPARAALTVQTQPEGATLFLAGRAAGTTPITLSGLAPAATMPYALVKAGYASQEGTLALVAGETTKLTVDLRAVVRYGAINIAVQDPTGGVSAGRLFEHGKFIGEAPVQGLRLAVGRHELVLRNPAMSWSKSFVVHVDERNVKLVVVRYDTP